MPGNSDRASRHGITPQPFPPVARAPAHYNQPMKSLRQIVPVVLLTLSASLAAQKIENFTFEVDKLGGGKLRAQDFADNVLIVDLWGTWCPPCRAAVPHLQRLYAKYKHHGLEIVGFNYEQGSRQAQTKLARDFAIDKGITYALALGTPDIQRQVPKFSGYPTLLFFSRGLIHSHTDVGFSAGHEKKIEQWIRKELGLEAGDEAEPEKASEGEPAEEAEEADAGEDVEVPPGAIYKPGQGDKGFDFEATDADGKAMKFKELRGKPVVVALMASWDSTAVNTGKLVERLSKELGDKAHVLAASLERGKDPAAKQATLKDFLTKNSFTYRAVVVGTEMQKKIYLFTGMPLFLVFDAEGKLVAREPNAPADELFTKLVDAAK